jgi:NADH-dependent peroxiredoxin subunit F
MDTSHDPLFDLVIIGASAAGMSAAIYAARRNLHFVIVTTDIGGEVARSGEVENWPGIIHTTGIELARMFEDHVKKYAVRIDTGRTVTALSQDNGIHAVHTADGTGTQRVYQAKAVLIGSGIHPRTLGVPGEEALRGRGVTYCTVCDGPLFRGKVTATVGAGNAALESALMMSGIAKEVHVFSKFPNTPEKNGGFPKGENILIDKLKACHNVHIHYGAKTTGIAGGPLVQSIAYTDESGNACAQDVQGVMIHIGNIPNSSFAEQLARTATGEIIVDQRCATSVSGIFAAGDVTNIPYKQIVIAAGQGVTAALSAIEYLNRLDR